MREKNIVCALLALNLALFLALSSYLLLSLHERPTGAWPLPRKAQPQPAPQAPREAPLAPADPHVLKMAAARPLFSFRDLETTNYAAYLQALRRAGCPEHHLRHIVLSDVAELFAQKRIEEAIRHDFEWWRAEPQPIVARLLREKGQELEEQRLALVKKFLGACLEQRREWWHCVPLTGAVLGALSEEMHSRVQEVCRQSISVMTADPEAKPAEIVSAVERARARERVRAELANILSAEQLEHFLLRYSPHASALRKELRPLQPAAEEFRRMFAAVEPLERELQNQFGSADALAVGQRERYEHRRTEAVRHALAPERFAAYLLARNDTRGGHLSAGDLPR